MAAGWMLSWVGMKQLTLTAVGFERLLLRWRGGPRFLLRWNSCAVVGAVRADRAVLSEAGQWPPAGGSRVDAAHLFLATIVRPV